MWKPVAVENYCRVKCGIEPSVVGVVRVEFVVLVML